MKLHTLHLRQIVATSATAAVILGGAGGLLTPANAASGPTCDADSCDVTFSYTGATETFTVPSWVSALTVSVSGAQGSSVFGYRPGGMGATVSGVLPITPGDELTVLVGEAGAVSGSATFGGGGSGTGQYLGSGGGGSFVFDSDGDPLLVAGGGGAATDAASSGGVGAGAGSTGGSGTGPFGYPGEVAPTGGTSTSGGIHGHINFSDGNDGSGPAAGGQVGRGGDGGGSNIDSWWVGGGGGGGYYGGGGGAYTQAGGGGSGYADASVTDLVSTDGANGGNGVVSISWALLPTSVNLTSTPKVHGQATQVTATVGNGGGTATGTVQFAVDGTDVGAPVTLVGGSAQSPALMTAGGAPLAVGGHAVTASYSPAEPAKYAGSTGSTTQVVNPASTTTAVSVRASSIRAIVAPVAPGAGVATGTVTFRVAGRSVGTAKVVDGVGTLSYKVPTGSTQTVAAVYSGSASFTASSDSTSRSNPSITATVTSAHPKSRSGWYRSPVTVTFHCTTHGAPLVAPCPRPVQLTANGAAQSVTRTIAAADGGVATLSAGGINLDRSAPSVKVTGISNGAGYGGQAPAARCFAKDGLSGVVSCKITRNTRGSLTSYTATATDRAGNTTTAHGSYRVLSIYVQGAPYRDGVFSVRAGRGYTVVVTGQAERPTYYDAALYPSKPTQRDMAFYAAGHHRWALGVTVDRAMRSHEHWYLGVKIGHTMHLMKVRVTG